MKLAVYTCITGNYDAVKEFPEFIESDVDYYLFTNNRSISSEFWNVIQLDEQDLDNIRLARKIKVLGHPLLDDYDATVWMDGASYPRCCVSRFVELCCDLSRYSLIGFAHHERDCVYDEALECVKVKKDDITIIERQISNYRSQGYPEHNGLIESTVMVRRTHDSLLKATMEAWFSEIRNYSFRDQLSFNYIAEQTGLDYRLLDISVFDNEYFGWTKHVDLTTSKNLRNYFVYFGSDDQFDFDSFLSTSYTRNKNEYRARFTCLKKCDEFKIELAQYSGIEFSDLHVSCAGATSQNLVNWSRYLDCDIFDGGTPTLFLYGSFQKDQVVEVTLKMSLMTEDRYLELLHRFNLVLWERSTSGSDQSTSSRSKTSGFFNRLKMAMKP